MRRTGLLWAAAILVVANAAAWGAAALNRRGEPEASLELTERELRLPAKQAENTALTLSLLFEAPGTRGARVVGEAGWFDRAKLESIGFDCRRPVIPDNAEYYRTRIPRSTFAALEARDAAATGWHLTPIDVDNSPSALRQRHPDRRRVAIVEATAALRYIANPGQPPFVTGQITSVLPGEIHVPREWRGLLEGLQPSRRTDAGAAPLPEPRFRATVVWGRRLEPWIASVELLK